ncbi:hypothetical protein PR003_g14748 [Phytophthora rubi]|uniref:FYVE-type domain-containing protein n=1 Tax=Phytophthora rubi TaxID=129364 RepID=A0A6A3L6N1_9STRA|nr:hypothetical protein PR002_g14226 [Phytophthora rubi]KAE9020349.1 hypothetical protein PR001_g13628 [Phytophthora rubi]KAE9331975.1 hypothetical protein PR003_g14748 [Phytophthora rubi]
MSSPPSFRRSRVERASSVDLASSSLFRRFQGKKTNSGKTPTEPLAASQPPPRHSHRRILSRDRRRPMVIYYSSNSDESQLSSTVRSLDATVYTDGELSEDELATPSSRLFGEDDRFDADVKVPDFAATAGPRDTTGRSRGGRALMRMSQTFSRASERIEPKSMIDPHGDGRRDHRRAARQSAKYDVAWREDDESECCRVCFAMFTKLSRRRHHCRVCGELVCGACSQDQVSLTNKFSTPRRACVACCSLLQAMARAGDDRVKVVEPDTATATPAKRHHQSAPVATCHSPAGNSLPAPAATPRYRDRLTEVHRVMAAGKLSRRRGSAEKKMFVISSRWLRTWLTFTSSASSSNSSRNLDYGFEPENSSSSPSGKSDKAAPGPIDNLSLLELSRGKLVRRPGLIRDEVLAGEAASSVEDADYQLLSPEVWEVFQRLYGGAPAIYVNLTSDDPTEWIVDVCGLLVSGTNSNGAKVQVIPAVERALTTRHHSENAFVSNPARTPTESPVSSRFAMSSSKLQPPKSPAWTATSSSSSSSLSEDKDRVRTPTGSGKMQLEDLESDVAAMSVGVRKVSMEEHPGEDDTRSTTSMRSPTAALAASAFAVAMKQARLNAQKAIDDRASRVVAA